jgi:hypothetical protein
VNEESGRRDVAWPGSERETAGERVKRAIGARGNVERENA